MSERLRSRPLDRRPADAGRRHFFRRAGIGLAGAGLLLAACDDDDDDGGGGMMTPDTVSLGTGDAGVLNYAYALEQLEAAFYAQVQTGGYYASASAAERSLFDDLEAHERAHREFFAAAIATVATPIPGLEVDFSSVDFDSRESVLATAQTFEDLGVSAYNGAGRLLTNPDFLTIAGKIVSVEARHAAAIRSLNSDDPTAFAGNDVVTVDNGLDVARTPAEVLSAASAFIVTPIDASGLPS